LGVQVDLEQALERSEFSLEERNPAKRKWKEEEEGKEFIAI
jgi:hypothetical protein